MAIYGTAILSGCLIVGSIIGNLIGESIGVDANVGGVGLAMLMLIFVSSWLQSKGWLAERTELGIRYWSLIYIPVVVAMAASQNVRGAITGGAVAIVAGTLAVLVCFALVPLISGFSNDEDTNNSTPDGESS